MEDGKVEMSEQIWFVIGGVYTDGSFANLEEGTAEVHGPYPSEDLARKAHDGFTRRNLDICWHKLYVVRTV